MRYLGLNKSKGFTLMEVLVATAITGIAIGVTMAIFAQGHSQAFRGLKAKKAAQIATRLIDTWRATKHYPSEAEGEVEFEPGWTYKLFANDVKAKVILPSGETKIIEPENAAEIVLKLIPPDKKRAFVLTFWVPLKEVKGP